MCEKRMKPLKEVCASFQLNPKKYRLLGNVIIVEDTDKKLVIKKKYLEKQDLYHYLDLRGFHHFVPLLQENSNYEIYPYVAEVSLPKEQKALDLVFLMSLLHNKTTFYRSVDLDRVKEFYEDKNAEIDYLFRYYQDLQIMIEKHVYMSPSEYLLIRNISIIYKHLKISKDYLEEWYKLVSKKQKERLSLVHHHLTLEHLLEKDQGYFISWDRASMDIPIYDFYYFYLENDPTLDYTTLYDVYTSKYPLQTEEELRLFILLSIPHKLVLKDDEALACRTIYQELKRLQNVNEMISKKQKEDTKEEQEKFQN